MEEGTLTVRHFPAVAALPAERCQKVAARRLNVMVRPHSTTTRQTLRRSVPSANRNDSTAMARRKKPNDAAKAGSSRPADGSSVLYCVE